MYFVFGLAIAAFTLGISRFLYNVWHLRSRHRRRQRRLIIAVIGSGTADIDAAQRTLAADIGDLIADEKCLLITGGGGGVMEAASQGYARRAATLEACHALLAIGVLPAASEAPAEKRSKDGYPNVYVDCPLYTHLDGVGRSHIIIKSAHRVIALIGNKGTSIELDHAENVYHVPLMRAQPDTSRKALRTFIRTGEHQ